VTEAALMGFAGGPLFADRVGSKGSACRVRIRNPGAGRGASPVPTQTLGRTVCPMGLGDPAGFAIGPLGCGLFS
jgi:hypothetical protein